MEITQKNERSYPDLSIEPGSRVRISRANHYTRTRTSLKVGEAARNKRDAQKIAKIAGTRFEPGQTDHNRLSEPLDDTRILFCKPSLG